MLCGRAECAGDAGCRRCRVLSLWQWAEAGARRMWRLPITYDGKGPEGTE